MHELTICEALLGILDGERRRRRFTAVSRVRVEIGRFSCLDPDALQFAFEVSTRDTYLDGARLEIDRPPGRATCRDCGCDVELANRLDQCPTCGGVRLETHGGDQMRLVEMEIR